MSDSENQPGGPKKNKIKNPNSIQGLVVAALILAIIGMFFMNGNSKIAVASYKELETMVLAGDVTKVSVVEGKKEVEITLKTEARNKYKEKIKNARFTEGPHFKVNIVNENSFMTQFPDFIKSTNLSAADQSKLYPTPVTRIDYMGFLGSILPIVLMLGIMYFIISRMSGGGGPGGALFNIGKSKAALFDAENKVKITFENVAGLDEAKEELTEIVDFLKKPKKYTDLGAKIPKGALLVGPPGTGKTLLAKAVAGEASVPFFSLSGSDFVEMFVGVGAARVRDLFKQAKEKAPCIIFIDEIDAVGRSRGRASMPGGNDERENTLNSLLVEMDGFGSDTGIIILAATNRPDVLDTALLRPGRFDRQISVDVPDLNGREAIFRVHLKPIKINEEVDPKKLATQTPGFAGAEIANICNEAALLAARRGQTDVRMKDFQDAVDREIGGLEKRNKLISPEEKEIVAYHEAGHAIAGWYLEHANPLVKVSIVPRGIAALGYAQYLPKEQFLYRTEQLRDEMCMALGGRAAEDIVFGKITTGALSDLEKITKMAYSMVSIYGMNDKIGNVSFYDSKGQGDMTFTKPYSDQTAQLIDEEVKKMIEIAYTDTKNLLILHREKLNLLATELLKREIIYQQDLVDLIGERPFAKETVYAEYMNKKPEPIIEKVVEVAETSEAPTAE
jgi:AFG3 family protein